MRNDVTRYHFWGVATFYPRSTAIYSSAINHLYINRGRYVPTSLCRGALPHNIYIIRARLASPRII